MHRLVGDSQNSLRSREVRFNISTSLTFPQNKLKSCCIHAELHLLPTSSSDELLPPNKSSFSLSALRELHLLPASSSDYLLPPLPCLVMSLLRRTNQQTWLLAASCVPRWCTTAAEEFPAISLPRAWGKNLTCQCLPSNADLLRRKDLC